MSISLHWNNPQQTALKLTFTAPWVWEDYERISPQIAQAFASVNHPVDLMIEMSHAGQLPQHALYHLRSAYADETPNLRQYVFVGASDEFKTLFSAADRYYTALGGKLNFHFA